MRREQAADIIDRLIVTAKATGEPYFNREDIEALEFAHRNLVNTGTLKGMLIFDRRQCEIGGWKDRLKVIETAEVLFDKYLED